METAKLMVAYALPIKCMESVIVAIYLTNHVRALVRFPISFKSCHNGTYYYHIVLGLIFDGKFGAAGLSRKSNLMGPTQCAQQLTKYEALELRHTRWGELPSVVFYGICHFYYSRHDSLHPFC